MIFLSTEKLGGLKINNEYINISKKPWDTVNELYPNCGIGDIYQYKDLDHIEIDNTPNEDIKQLSWYKFKLNDRVIYVCDRVVVNNLSHDVLSSILNTTYAIDGKQYRLKALSEYDLLNLMSGEILGTPECYEWFDSKITKSSMDNPHNKFWNYVGQGTYVVKDENFIGVGYYSPSYTSSDEFNSPRFGLRPILEELSDKPIIEGESGRIGEFKESFVYEYNVKSHMDNDVINVVEKINNEVVNTYSTDGSIESPMKKIDLSNRWSELGQGVHTIEIIATNSNNVVSNSIVTFSTTPAVFLDKDGLDYYTKQLWSMKIKPLVEEFSKKAGGLVLDSSSVKGGSPSTIVDDKYANNGRAINILGGSDYVHGAKWETSDIRLGKYALTLRASTQGNISTGEQFIVIVNKVSNGVSTEITRKNFSTNLYTPGLQNYKVLNMTFEYTGIKNEGDYIRIEVVSGKNNVSYNCRVDYVMISPLLPSSFA